MEKERENGKTARLTPIIIPTGVETGSYRASRIVVLRTPTIQREASSFPHNGDSSETTNVAYQRSGRRYDNNGSEKGQEGNTERASCIIARTPKQKLFGNYLLPNSPGSPQEGSLVAATNHNTTRARNPNSQSLGLSKGKELRTIVSKPERILLALRNKAILYQRRSGITILAVRGTYPFFWRWGLKVNDHGYYGVLADGVDYRETTLGNGTLRKGGMGKLSLCEKEGA